jgi:hypothetical protein
MSWLYIRRNSFNIFNHEDVLWIEKKDSKDAKVKNQWNIQCNFIKRFQTKCQYSLICGHCQWIYKNNVLENLWIYEVHSKVKPYY